MNHHVTFINQNNLKYFTGNTTHLEYNRNTIHLIGNISEKKKYFALNLTVSLKGNYTNELVNI